MSMHGQGHPSSKDCRWGGGNDYLACRDCGIEYDYRKGGRPPCGAKARIAELLKQKHQIELQLFELAGGGYEKD